MNDSFDGLRWSMEEAKLALEAGRIKATNLHLEGTECEISRALSSVESILFEMERKVEPEFAQFRDHGP
jgi:hypothetical protein